MAGLRQDLRKPQEKHSACSDPGWWRGEARRHEWLVFKAVSKLLGGYSCRMFRCSTKKRIVWGYTWCSDATNAEKRSWTYWMILAGEEGQDESEDSFRKKKELKWQSWPAAPGHTGTQVTGSGFVWAAWPAFCGIGHPPEQWKGMKSIWVCLKMVYTPNEIAI